MSLFSEALGAPASRNLKMCWCQELFVLHPLASKASSDHRKSAEKRGESMENTHFLICFSTFSLDSLVFFALQEGLGWDNDVRKGLASLVRQGLTPRVEIASDEAYDSNLDNSDAGEHFTNV